MRHRDQSRKTSFTENRSVWDQSVHMFYVFLHGIYSYQPAILLGLAIVVSNFVSVIGV